jgi:hypothetical protein
MAPAAMSPDAMHPTSSVDATAMAALAAVADAVLSITYPMGNGSVSLPVSAGSVVRVHLLTPDSDKESAFMLPYFLGPRLWLSILLRRRR